MLEFLQKFNNLPVELREKVSAPAVMQAIGEIEKSFGISLAILIMKVMVKDIKINDLEKYFAFEHNLSAEQAKELAVLLKKKIFFEVSDYLGFDKNKIEDEKLNNWMQEKREAMSARDASFYFSPEDEEEVKDLAKKLAGYNPTLLAGDSSEENANKLIKELNINFSSSDLQNRFKQILKTYLKGIRRKIEIREALLKPIAYGGMEMGDVVAERILKYADNFLAGSQTSQIIKQPAKIAVPEDLMASFPPGVNKNKAITSEQPTVDTGDDKNEKLTANTNNIIRDVEYDFNKLAALPKKVLTESESLKPQADIAGTGPSIKEIPADTGSSALPDEKKDQPKSINYDEIISRAKRIAQSANVGLKSEFQPAEKVDINQTVVDVDKINVINARRQKNIDGKVRMDDVKYIPKLMGPVDELRELDLANFRRIDNDSRLAVEKIREKISFLEDESYSQRLKGIKSWRQSPINKLYLEIGEESIVNKKPINVIIDERRNEGRDYITSEEFNAIMELNKDLRY